MGRLFLVLLWKIYVLRKRRYIITLLELVVPIFLFWLFVHLKDQAPEKENTVSEYSWESERPYDEIDGDYNVAYTPSNSVTDDLIRTAISKINGKVNISAKSSEEEVVNWLKYGDDSLEPHRRSFKLVVGVIFSNLDDPKTYTYTLRTENIQTSSSTIYGGQSTGGHYSYKHSGFLAIQSGLDRAYLSKHNINITSYNVILQRLPYLRSSILDMLPMLLLLFIIIGFNVTYPSLLRGIVEEKSSGIKELMMIMGLRSFANWIGWMVYALTVYVPLTLVIAWLVTTDYDSGRAVNANYIAVWILLILFALGFIMLIFAISTFFTSGTLAIVSALILWYVVSILLIVYFINSPDHHPLWLNLITCLWPSVCLHWCLQTINNFEKSGQRWTLVDLFDDGAGGGRVSVGLAALMFLAQIIFYGCITWYMDNVKPGPYGRAKPLLFIFQCFEKNDYNANTTPLLKNPNSYEEPPKDVKIGIKIENLRKTFKNGKVCAVEHVDLDIYEGNITALLGHNGAGKTTTMSMLAGFFSPTSGRVIVKGRNIFDHMDEFRLSLGFCTQHNLLFQYFTVLEHLVFFGMLKGLPKSQAERDGIELLRAFKMEAKENVLVSTLSGGMKRKLCLCIALMGDPEILLLDEPTSGLDPESRRQVWDILLGFRGQRTTIITTHFMEEADVLGDRIVIMDHGQVSCYGTTIFLKKLYGTGYRLNISTLAHAPVPPIVGVVEKHVTSESQKQGSPSQLTFNIRAEETSHLPALFSALDSSRGELGLTAVRISCTTMEDVFLRVAQEEPDTPLESGVERSGESQDYNNDNVTGFGLVCQQLKALIIKRMLTRLRSWKSTLTFIIIPVLLSAWTVSATMMSNFTIEHPSLKISVSTFPNVHVAVSSENQSVRSALQRLVTSGGGVYDAIPPDMDYKTYFLNQIRDNLVKYERLFIAGFKFNSSSFIGGYSPKFAHSTPLVLNMIANSLLQANNISSSITTYNHPLHDQGGASDTKKILCDTGVIAERFIPICVILLSLGLLILTMSFISFPLKERISNSKQLQLMTGVSPVLYWLVNIVADFVLYLITMFLCIAMFYIFQDQEVYSSSGYMGTLIVVFALYGVSGITFAHAFGFFVGTPVMAAAMFIILNLITGLFAAVLFIYIGQFKANYEIYRHILSFNPGFAVTFALSNLLTAMYVDGLCIQCKPNCKTKIDPITFYQAGKGIFEAERGIMKPNLKNLGIVDFMIYLAVDAILYFLLIMIIEYGFVKKLWFFISKIWIKMDNKQLEEDSDVLIEKERVKSTQSAKEDAQSATVLCASDLGKKYNRETTAVHGVSFQVGQGECFGLLGVNGAGKTTTFKMLTGEELPTKGDASILQFSLSKKKSKFLSLIGYCPQFDAINPQLTGKEMLTVYARLRGIPSSQQPHEVSRWIQMMGLKEYADRPCGVYSGGNKRKLSTAMAFIGSPPVVFLDEPTSGVDPVSRRRLWDVVARCQRAGQAIVLTSHSMEECEALCSRLTIMAAGQMKCIGSTQYLKNKFGQGHTIKIKLFSSSRVENAVTKLKSDMANQFKNCLIKDEHWGLLHYHIQDSSVRLSDLFTKMENLKKRHDIIEDYIVSDTTLEQVFLSFAQPSEEGPS